MTDFLRDSGAHRRAPMAAAERARSQTWVFDRNCAASMKSQAIQQVLLDMKLNLADEVD